jgi:hypothetical protein
VKVGDLVRAVRTWFRDSALDGRCGIIIADVPRTGAAGNKIFKVLWNEPCPSRPSFAGTSWDHDLEVISEGR